VDSSRPRSWLRPGARSGVTRKRASPTFAVEERTALVRVDGELWEAVPRDGLASGQRVEIVSVDGLRLLVRPIVDERGLVRQG